ncbi:copper homeostasis protein CutC [Pedobacter psychroterrae]|uniref:PF03932 family protein CutC n=1 Tax=Pedobacter psychroterrae TaxID=2530453 RepID=A0A4R0NM58_9SPHI|nr:copper homeostasis protein CutC [Pedobacter psychroterrae]TCD01746.1 copper homeostasis protein CutC [Pedobacter psychroterrae]
MVNMEVCANSLASALAAQEGGAVRVELCDNLPEGGTTPSYAQIALARRLLSIKLYPIIRPRGGDFLYTDLEFELMKEDIRICKALNSDGIVIGILNADGSVDMKRCAELVELARPMQVTFHRAFDMSSDLFIALEDIISLGCERILTSGGEASAITGATVLAKLIEQANERIIIMPGAGITNANIAELIKITGAIEFHASARSSAASKMLFKNQKLSMGTEGNEFSHDTTSPNKVRELIAIANRSA